MCSLWGLCVTCRDGACTERRPRVALRAHQFCLSWALTEVLNRRGLIEAMKHLHQEFSIRVVRIVLAAVSAITFASVAGAVGGPVVSAGPPDPASVFADRRPSVPLGLDTARSHYIFVTHTDLPLQPLDDDSLWPIISSVNKLEFVSLHHSRSVPPVRSIPP